MANVNNQSHTPTPWHQDGDLVRGEHEIIALVDWTGNKDRNQANLEFILKACNQYYDLLDAPRPLLKLFKTVPNPAKYQGKSKGLKQTFMKDFLLWVEASIPTVMEMDKAKELRLFDDTIKPWSLSQNEAEALLPRIISSVDEFKEKYGLDKKPASTPPAPAQPPVNPLSGKQEGWFTVVGLYPDNNVVTETVAATNATIAAKRFFTSERRAVTGLVIVSIFEGVHSDIMPGHDDPLNSELLNVDDADALDAAARDQALQQDRLARASVLVGHVLETSSTDDSPEEDEADTRQRQDIDEEAERRRDQEDAERRQNEADDDLARELQQQQ